MKNFLTLILLSATTLLTAQNQPPQITNLSITLNNDETLTINYDLVDAENDDAMVTFHVSENGGNSFQINTEDATGDLNTMLTPGTDKSITWDYANVLTTSDNYVLKLVADDLQTIDIQEIVNQVDSNNLKTDLALIEGIRHRNTGADHLQAVRDLLNQRFLDAQLRTEKQEFNFGAYIGENYIGTNLGTTTDNEIYIVDAHYDGVDDAPAADDNGSGVAGVLEAARILSNYNFKKTIRFIGFDLEEAGLQGSQAYVINNIPEEENIAGVLNFEMIGYYTNEVNSQSLPTGFNLLFADTYAAIEADSFRGNFIANIGVAGQNDWEQAYADAAVNYVPDLKVITFAAPQNWQALTPDLGRSDHAPFWLSNRPATMITGTAEFRNPNYHSAADTLGTINFEFMTNVVKAAVATLAEEAELQNSSFAIDSVDIVVNSTVEVAPCTPRILPNPVKDILQITFDNCGVNWTNLKIFNLHGQLVIEQSFAPNAPISINVKNWKSGVYFLETAKGVERFLKH